MLNLTQHKAAPEQYCNELNQQDRLSVRAYSTFGKLPDYEDLDYRAKRIADIAVKVGVKEVIIGGENYFMPHLVKSLLNKGITPYYAFTQCDAVGDYGIQTPGIKYFGLIEAKISV